MDPEDITFFIALTPALEPELARACWPWDVLAAACVLGAVLENCSPSPVSMVRLSPRLRAKGPVVTVVAVEAAVDECWSLALEEVETVAGAAWPVTLWMKRPHMVGCVSLGGSFSTGRPQ